MLPALASLTDLETRLGLDAGTLSDPDRARAEAALNDASALVREEARREWLTDGEPDAPDVIVRVVLGAALRNYRNPEGEISQTVGPFSRTIKAAESGVYLTTAELEIVRRYRQNTSSLWTQPTTRGESLDETFWLEDSYGHERFPIGVTTDPW